MNRDSAYLLEASHTWVLQACSVLLGVCHIPLSMAGAQSCIQGTCPPKLPKALATVSMCVSGDYQLRADKAISDSSFHLFPKPPSNSQGLQGTVPRTVLGDSPQGCGGGRQ